jgi:3-methylcrotonyl-CoA carboxylase alpha subunit
MFERLLVANRGEIALRVLQACAELGITGVAVHGPEDGGAIHVRRAPLSLPISSYLDVEAVVDAARHARADALHPGYGFLSENPDLGAACASAGIAFVGPPPEAMRLLGDKRRARALARSLEVPVLAGYEGPDAEDEPILAAAAEIGFPLLVKAAAGGGGRGIRRVERAADLPPALLSARREAQSAFGDPTIYLEREAPRARHIEVQVLADAHGNVVHLGERECSVQRRHQKVLEEAPSPAVTPELRERLGGYAVRLAGAAGYVNAGTAEFLLTPAGAPEGAPHFLEVNARLQVEHPVTEQVTGIDLVREQIRIAAGQPLSFRQEDVRWRGHALQCRVYAEDPRASFRPAAGPVLLCEPPQGAGIRNDVGVETGDVASVRYDPLLAKLTVWAPDRPAALSRARGALRRYAILGVTTNLPLLRAIVAAPAFQRAEWDTGTLERLLPDLLTSPPEGALEAGPLLVAAGWRLTAPLGRTPWRLGEQGVPLRFLRDGQEERVTAWRTGEGWELDAAGTRCTLRFRRTSPFALTVEGPDRAWGARVVEHQGALYVAVEGQVATFSAPRASDSAGPAAPAASGAGEGLLAPVPGAVLSVNVAPGDTVDAGQPLVLLEAMKMEFAVSAPSRGTVRRVACAPGEQVAAGALLVELGP